MDINRNINGKNALKYCPERRKVWQLKYDPTGHEDILIVYSDMPSYGLIREVAPKNKKERGG